MQSEEPEHADQEAMHEYVGPIQQGFSIPIATVGVRFVQDEIRVCIRVASATGFNQVLRRDR